MFVTLYYILFALTLLYGLYFGLTGLIAFKNMKKDLIPKHKPKNKFAILIAARNEEDVIGNLIESIKLQRYPEDLYDIIVIPNNCTDDTRGAAIKAGAKVIDCTVKTKTKGEVLQYTFSELVPNSDYDAFVIFDADNLVHRDFLARMNDALCEGFKVCQGFRDCKNMGDNWLTGSYTLFYYIQNFFYNRARMFMDGSATINGTGFCISREVLETIGFPVKTITEDSEFTGICAIHNIRVGFVEKAITYDEHPLGFKASWKQRKRWTSGSLSCLKNYYKDLIKAFFKTGNIACLDMLLMYLAPISMVAGTISMGMLMAFKIFGVELYDIFSYLFAAGFFLFILFYLFNILLNIFTVKYNHKKVEDIFAGVFLFSFFLATWVPINFICLFKKTKDWEQIKHDRKVNIKDITQQ